MNAKKQPVWLITGAAGALGREMVRLVLASGADCIALDRDARGLNALHDKLQESGLPPPALVPLDLVGAGPDDYAQLAETIESQFGGVDVLVHNAATFTALRPIEHQPPEEWMKTLQTGLTGPFLLTRALLPLMRGRSDAKLIFIADHHCLEKPANWGAYGLAQAGRAWMARALAGEMGPRGPRVLDIDPGPFYSPLRAAAWPVVTPAELPDPAAAAYKVLEHIEQGVQ
jgi:NAD(P)-dependent dehydrogenase (short-subunit alcohol dehydrogenase family)